MMSQWECVRKIIENQPPTLWMLRDGRSAFWGAHADPNALKHVLKKAFPDPTLDKAKRWKCFVEVFKDEITWCDGKIMIRGSDDDDGSEECIEEETVDLTHEEASVYLRLSYAFCYYTAQGRTIRDRHVVLLDTRHRNKAGESYFTLRHLIVGMSRATYGKYVNTPTAEQEKDLIRQAHLSKRKVVRFSDATIGEYEGSAA